jgi:hypothetical protein
MRWREWTAGSYFPDVRYDPPRQGASGSQSRPTIRRSPERQHRRDGLIDGILLAGG